MAACSYWILYWTVWLQRLKPGALRSPDMQFVMPTSWLLIRFLRTFWKFEKEHCFFTKESLARFLINGPTDLGATFSP